MRISLLEAKAERSVSYSLCHCLPGALPNPALAGLVLRQEANAGSRKRCRKQIVPLMLAVCQPGSIEAETFLTSVTGLRSGSGSSL